MIAAFLLIWIGLKLNAPTWFYLLCGVLIILKAISFGIEMYKKGKK